ncbi:hypothetical protein GA0061070_100885 [Kosakonia oryziphila]|uniref:Uncharacterized protein n=1 Tax=Kosakonia oryziphila TaxID=1005667 RepID=A0A1C4BP41_9ENTR|nr:hypothetical protein GA0061070_100885 [Kosakonia oryziphila]
MIIIELAVIGMLLVIIVFSFYKHFKVIRSRTVGNTKKNHRR